MKVLQRLWSETDGFIVSSELVLGATLLVIGMVTGLAAVRDSVNQELADVAAAIGDISQSYAYGAMSGHHASSDGTFHVDLADDCDSGDSNPSECVSIECDIPRDVDGQE